MLTSVTKAAFALSLVATIASAANVTATKLPSDCSSYPSYNSTAGTAGPLIVRADSATIEELNGLQLGASSFTNDGVDRFGFITLPKQAPRNPLSNVTFRCANGVFQALLPAAQFYPNDPTAQPVYVDLKISTEENWQASLSFKLEPSVPVELYSHSIDGVKQPGVFLGANGQTTWNLKHNWGGNAGEYFLVRLAGGVEGLHGGSEMRKRQFPTIDDRDASGFLKIL